MVTMPDDEKSQSTGGGATKFEDLQGLLNGALDSLGGGEAFLRRERDGFYEHDLAKKEE